MKRLFLLFISLVLTITLPAALCAGANNTSTSPTTFSKGVNAYLTGNYDNAIANFNQCLSEDPHMAAAEYLLGQTAYAQGKTEKAAEHYQNALKLDFQMGEARIRLARLLSDQKKYSEANRQWYKILAADPADKEALAAKNTLDAIVGQNGKYTPRQPGSATPIEHSSTTVNTALLKVGLGEGIARVELWAQDGLMLSNGTTFISETTGTESLTVNATSPFFHNSACLFITTKTGSSGIVIKEITTAGAQSAMTMAGRQYRGKLLLLKAAKGITLVNVVTYEDYLYSVLPSEMLPWWPQEALRAQAIISRTQALCRAHVLKPHAAAGYDVCACAHCLSYDGITEEVKTAHQAVDSSRGLILTKNGQPCNAQYCENCGGCELSKYVSNGESRWTRVVTQEELSGRINAIIPVGSIVKLVADKTSASGHITQLTVTGTKDTVILDHESEIRSLAPGGLRSTKFSIEAYGKEKDLSQLFIFHGLGWGSGLGLCQAEVAALADKGMSCQDILAHFFADIQLSDINQ